MRWQVAPNEGAGEGEGYVRTTRLVDKGRPCDAMLPMKRPARELAVTVDL